MMGAYLNKVLILVKIQKLPQSPHCSLLFTTKKTRWFIFAHSCIFCMRK